MRISDWSSDVCSSDLLRELEEDGLITRTVYAEVPPRVEYAMTEATKALEPTIASLLRWWREHGKEASKDKKKRQPNRPSPSLAEKRRGDARTSWKDIGKASSREGVGQYD